MAESYSVTAVLSAQDKNFSSVFGSAQSAADGLAGKLKSGLGFGVMQAIGMKAVNTVTGAIGGMTGSVMETGKAFSSSMAQVAATMGKPVSEIQELSSFAREMGATTSFSATQAADALNYMALAGYDADKSMRTLPTVLNLAAAGSMELATASDMVTDASSALGLSEQQTAAMVNQMAQAASKSNTSVSQLGEAFLTVGATARNLKGGTTELSTVLGVLADNGIKGSEGGTHLRNILLALQSPTKDAAEGLSQLGVSVYDAEGNMRSLPDIIADMQNGLEGMDQASRDAIISGIFNKTDLASVNALLNTSQGRFDELSDSIENCGDAAKEMADTQLDNLEGDTKLLSSAMDELRLSIFDNFNTPMRIATKVATSAVTAISDKVKSLGDIFDNAFDLKSVTEALESEGITGALEVIAGSLGNLPEGFQSAATAAAALGSVGVVNSVLDSRLWKAGVAGVKSFGSVTKTLPAMISKGFSDAGNRILNVTSRTFPQVLTGLSTVGDKAGGIFSKISQTGSNAWSSFTSDSVLGKAVGKVTGFAGKIGGALGQVGGVILNVGGQLAAGLQTMMGAALQALMPAAMIGAALAGLGLLQEKFGEQINGILSMVQEKGPQVISSFANGISSRIPELISQGSTLVSNLLNTIGALAPSAVAAGAQIIMSLVSGVAQNAPQLISGAVTAVGGFASGILSALPSLITSGMQLLLGVAQGISQNLPRMAQGAVQAVQNFAQGFIANLPMILTTAGQIVMTLVQGITSALPSLASGAVSIISTLAQGFISNLPQIIQTGVQVVASLALGIISGIGTLIGMIPQLFTTVKDTIMNTDWLDVGSQIVTAIGNGITGAIGGIGGKIGEFFGGISDWITGGEKGGTDYITASSNAITAGAPVVTGAAQETAASVSAASTASFLTGGTQGGLNLMTGFSTGIWNNVGLVTESATSAMTGATEILSDSSIQSDADTAGQDLVQSAASGIDSGASAAQSAVQSTMTSALSALSDSSAEAQSAGEAVGAAAVTGLSTGLEPMGEAARMAVSSAVSSMQTGLSSMQSAGQQAGTRFAAGIRTGLTQAATAARTSVKSIGSALKSVVSPAQSAGRQAGSRFASGVRAGAGSARSAGTAVGRSAVTGLRTGASGAQSAGATAGRAAVAGMRSGSSAARSAGSNAGSDFVSGVSSKSGSAKSAGSSLAEAAKNGMKGVSTSGIGKDMGQGLANGLNSKYGTVAAAAKRLANAAAQAMRAAAQIHSPSKVTEQIGVFFGKGFVKGINKQAAPAARAGINFINETTKPLSKTQKVGVRIANSVIQGLATKNLGKPAASYVEKYISTMKNAVRTGSFKTVANKIASAFKSAVSARSKTVGDSVASTITAITSSAVSSANAWKDKQKKAYDKYISQQKKYENAAKQNSKNAQKYAEQAKKATGTEKKALEEKAKKYALAARQQEAAAKKFEASAKRYKESVDRYTALASSYSKAGSTIKSVFSSTFTSKVNAAITATTNAITKLGETWQNKYNAIVEARTKFRDKMRELSLGEYDSETKKVVALTDYAVAARQVKQYGTNIENLKKILPQGMMNEILEMDTEEGLAYTQKLLSKGTTWLKSYAKSYNSYLSATSSVSRTYYQDQIDALNRNYKTAVEKEFKSLEKNLLKIGKDAIQGFVDGMRSKKTALDSAGKTLANSLIKTLKAQLKIKSPSRVMKSIGRYTGEGFVNGIDDEVRAARDAMARLVETPAPQLAMASGAENMRLNEDYSYSSNRHYTFEAVTTLDGREIARSTAEYNEAELERLRRNSERLKGRR